VLFKALESRDKSLAENFNIISMLLTVSWTVLQSFIKIYIYMVFCMPVDTKAILRI